MHNQTKIVITFLGFCKSKGKQRNPYRITLLPVCTFVKTILLEIALRYQFEISMRYSGL